MGSDVVYFELNDWWEDIYYPNEEPFISWCENLSFCDDKFVKSNELCIVESAYDMSVNWCITAKREWIEKMCPKLLTDHKKFLRFPNESGKVLGDFGDEFLEWSVENIGIHLGEDLD